MVGGEPEAAGDGVTVVGEGEGDGGEGGVAVVAVGIVLGRGAEADLDVGHATAGLVRGDDGAVLGVDADAVGIGDGVADEVGFRLRVGATEGGHGAVKLGVHGLQQDIVRHGLGGRCRVGVGRED